jgi:hypothetical protein
VVTASVNPAARTRDDSEASLSLGRPAAVVNVSHEVRVKSVVFMVVVVFVVLLLQD